MVPTLSSLNEIFYQQLDESEEQKEMNQRKHIFSGGQKNRPVTPLTAQCSHMDGLCLYSLTSRRRALQTINSAEAAAGAGRQPFAYRDPSTLNNGSSDTRVFGSATETRVVWKSLSSAGLYPSSQYLPHREGETFAICFLQDWAEN